MFLGLILLCFAKASLPITTIKQAVIMNCDKNSHDCSRIEISFQKVYNSQIPNIFWFLYYPPTVIKVQTVYVPVTMRISIYVGTLTSTM